MEKTRAWTRYQRRRTIGRKLGILRRTRGNEGVWGWTHGHPGRLSKGKIHCSCQMCRQKSYDSPTMADRRKKETDLQKMAEEML